MNQRLGVWATALAAGGTMAGKATGQHAARLTPCEFRVKQELVSKSVPGKGYWFQPRPTAYPGTGGTPRVIMTAQRALPGASDYFGSSG